jgi:hypothetical protein
VTVTWSRPHIVVQTTVGARSYGISSVQAFSFGALAAGTDPAAVRHWTVPIPTDVEALTGGETSAVRPVDPAE